MKIRLLIFSLTIGLAFSCIKEDIEPNKQGQIVTNEPHLVDTGNVDQFIMHGSIVSFGAIDVVEYGFVFTKAIGGTNVDPSTLDFDNIPTSNKVIKGSTNQGIKFFHLISTPPSGTYKIRAYIKLNGEDLPRFGNLMIRSI